ncbi:MAG TPA: hypothetical protein VKB84_25065 [Candidatus Binataceae bacterium]|nr:hypothetical protein [Candidatus Binataceae bacterium]
MRDGPSVRGSSKTSRTVSDTTLRLLVSSRGLATGHTPESRSPSAHNIPAAALPFQNLKFENCLPINLRAFLSGELGQRLYIDDTTIAPAAGEYPEAFMRDLARAIRRFSFARAHESWVEVVSSRLPLEEALTRSRIGACQVVLCLGCARISSGPNAVGEHRDSPCLTVALHGFTSCDYEQEQMPVGSQLRRNLYREIVGFRCTRQLKGLPHYDLDYYLRDNHYVFTWRPVADEQ